MKSLDHYVGELLLSNDCVVVPFFGGFVGNYRPSSLHPVSHAFHPPSKAISFNRMLMVNDGLLAHHISLSERISFDEALGIIGVTARRWNAQVDSGNTLELNSIGRIFKDKEGNFQFSQEGGRNFLISSYGMTSFHALPVMRRVEQVPVEGSEVKEEVRILPSVTRMAKYSVAAALLSVAVLTAYKLNVVPGLQNAGLKLNFMKAEKAMYTSRAYPGLGEAENRNEISAGEESVGKIMEYNAGIPGLDVIRIKPENITPSAIPASAGGDFHIVAGCFGVEENARKLMESLRGKGYDSQASLMQGRLRVVTYGSFSDRAEAKEFLQKVQSEENSEAWLLVKKA